MLIRQFVVKIEIPVAWTEEDIDDYPHDKTRQEFLQYLNSWKPENAIEVVKDMFADGEMDHVFDLTKQFCSVEDQGIIDDATVQA